MSRNSDAKKARRKKRQVNRDARWLPEDVAGALDDVDVELAQAVETFDEWLTTRGWTFDAEFSTDTLLSWFFEPSATAVVAEGYEPVTRIWITASGEDDDFPESVKAVLVGTGGEGDGKLYAVEPEVLLAHIDAVENYRPGAAIPTMS
ncbi:hypothetical protein FHT40_004698 [Mycolicibacterium sp. BK556]|uniref:hypothetical protein n=1 Tax=Mycobacteriaceae TaxID=1762 RepID=UPI001060587B|nr:MULTISPECIES: hypothetical protein [Mycobacteriaceae]MBB3605014.1 hypothetical protein [Mycolicibacterium sp. BK556]MBB3635210.1 hypothetical protein [Mycolicibacterium sp. BK607]MBB3747996.1 hypothetical protein [Mycolicibacterium sp. BK634]TDO07869.1 hypothetical protein EV580_5438 [Mycobacterium sp. BK086]